MSELIARIIPTTVSIDFADPVSREFVERDPYTGSYTVTPTNEAQTLATNGLRMTDDLTVEAIPPLTETKQISVTQNGTVTEDVAAYANAEISVNVPVPVLDSLSVVQNGEYTPLSGHAYDFVNVSVPQPTGTKQISIAQNGTTTHDIADYTSAEVTVAVPLPTLTSVTITDNGSYTPASGSAYNSVTVSVPSATNVMF